jgi:hypothetical protein
LEQQPEAPAKTVNIRGLKNWAVQQLPPLSKLRMLLLAENETMSPEVFLAKWSTWELLLREELV